MLCPIEVLLNVNTAMRRRSLRLSSFDYSSHGAYFITVVTARRAFILGRVVDDGVVLSAAGDRVLRAWLSLPARFPSVELDELIIMPNHVHGIVWLAEQGAASSAPTLGRIMRAFKSLSARAVNQALGRSGSVWQRNYYERVIRDERELNDIRQYIIDNPRHWAEDAENPECALRSATSGAQHAVLLHANARQ